jgi:hypothetical protein
VRRGENRILTSHAGALHRTALVEDGSDEETLAGAVADVVAWQVNVGVDVPNDGEMSKESLFLVLKRPLGSTSGFAGFSEAPGITQTPPGERLAMLATPLRAT